jgi:Putative beta-barrel porin-2, OmpL-like. bbp2
MLTGLLLGVTLCVAQPDTGSPPQGQSQLPAAPVASPVPATQPPSGLPASLPAAPPADDSKASTDKSCNCENGKNDSKPDNDKTEQGGLFFSRFFHAYVDQFKDKKDEPDDSTPAPRRALPAPFQSPPFPSGEYQGYPLIGVPPDDTVYPLMKAIYGGPWGDAIKDSRIKAYGWINASGNFSTAKNSNTPDSYWIVPNRFELDQLVFRVERQVDSVQTDHVDWGFRSTVLYGIDYRYMTAGGWFSDQLLKNNRLYGVDPTEQYFDVYFPKVAQGLIIRTGRWIACPDIETQFAPDNYMGTHSILFTFDTYTQTGVMATLMLNQQWTVQAGINAGNDMAPWYKGAIPCGMFGARWVAADNNDSVYAVLNQINNAQFRHFEQYDQPLGHDNFNYPVVTWQHKFSDCFHAKQEAYFMWQRNAELGGTPSAGPLEPFGGGGGDGTLLPGISYAYGTVNYLEFLLSKQDFLSVRNEWWKDERGMRSGFPGNYTSNAIGLTHNFNPVLQIRPEIGYYRNWNNDAFDLGTRKGIWIYGMDATLRF